MIRFIGLTFVILVSTGCAEKDTLFRKLASSHTGIHFNNEVKENDSINPIDLEFLYNGGGVAAADFNNDGATDLYLTASTLSNKLYINKGDLKFDDVTEQANVTGEGRWANGVSVVDINNDGWRDIYVSNTIRRDPLQRRNLLYVNQGAGTNRIPVFKEMSAEYGLADTSFSVQAAFFDYDNDGDLDMYLVTTKLAKRDGARFFNNNTGSDTTKSDVDKLFRNDWSDSLKHPYFTDVSREAGIVHSGFGLGLAIADINRDGWKDIYVTNDFYGSDHLYINQKNGTFIDRVNQSLGHTSQNAMGNDIADINNDGLADIIAVDMNPEDNFRKKKNMSGANYNVYQNQMLAGYSIQYVRNTLQLNMGPSLFENDSVGDPQFGDISFFAGVAETDWSWNPSLADFDNDGWRDLIVTNGYPRDVTDHDFTAYRAQAAQNVSTRELVEQIPQIKISNYAYRNTGDLRFQNKTVEWGLDEPSFSNGAVYADLDNDGDLDYVINNINEEAMVYENTTISKNKQTTHFIKIKYKGDKQNIDGLGAVTEIYYNGTRQVHENFPVRGYLSCVEAKSYFGLGSVATVDSIRVTWPDGKTQLLTNVAADHELIVDHSNSVATAQLSKTFITRDFQEITSKTGINYIHHEMDHIDYDDQRLLPHKLSQYGPGLAAGDVNGDGLDDLFVGGTGNFQGVFLLQQKNGTFKQKALPKRIGRDIRYPENMSIVFFDADNDNDLDVYFANGSTENIENSKSYADELLVNDGHGNFQWDTAAIPRIYTSKSAVRAADIDNDGDLDLFVGGRVRPGHYPQPASSFIYRNDSKNGHITFVDVTEQVAPALRNIGMVCDALWSDYDNDGDADLLLAGEWMPVTLFKNDNGKFANVTANSALAKYVGWWNSFAAGDFDNDGDIDYVVGNLGTNSYLRANDDHPVKIYQKDFDNNNKTEIIPTIFIKDEKGERKQFTVNNRDEIIEQLPGLKKKFLTYKEFGRADVNTIFGKQLDDAFSLQANYFSSSLLRNEGNGKFTVLALPTPFQLAPLYAMIAEDINGDGYLDIAATGNDFGNEVSNGRYDALKGIVAYGDGKGGFTCKRADSSGLFIPGDGKALVKVAGSKNKVLFAASQNRGALKLFRKTGDCRLISYEDGDRYALIHLNNGTTRKEEFYYGNSFLSQSSRFMMLNGAVDSVSVFNGEGKRRIALSKKTSR